jgi:hypothetical protein
VTLNGAYSHTTWHISKEELVRDLILIRLTSLQPHSQYKRRRNMLYWYMTSLLLHVSLNLPCFDLMNTYGTFWKKKKSYVWFLNINVLLHTIWVHIFTITIYHKYCPVFCSKLHYMNNFHRLITIDFNLNILHIHFYNYLIKFV